MATTYEEIIGYLNEEKVHFRDLREEGKDYLILPFSDGEDDEKPAVVFVRLKENGEFVYFFEPQRYKYVDGEHKAKVLETLLTIQYESNMLQWEYDPKDGEIRACIELPLEDAKLTKRLFLRVLKDLVCMMDHYHDRIKHVMETGEDTGAQDQRSAAISALEEMLARLRTTDEEAPEAV